MSLYNLLHGQNPATGAFLAALGLDQPDEKYPTGRFRDIYLSEDGKEIILFTRNGGGNREQYQSVIDNLATHPLYLRDYDDDFDCTYAYIVFSVPEDIKEECMELAKRLGKPETLKEKSDRVIKEMESMTPEQMREDPRFKPVAEALDQVINSEPGDGAKIITV